ncbi:MAG: hypothetical protein ACC651_11050 [Candidatus Scalindua sp.]
MSPVAEQEMKIFKKGDAEVETSKEGPELKCYFYIYTVNLHPVLIPYQELTDEEIITLAEKSGSFDFLNDPEEDIYSLSDGTPI